MRITLTDNQSKVYNRDMIKDLFPIADRSIIDICKENDNLLIFPDALDRTNDKIGQSSLINIKSTQDPNMAKIETGNIMGFVGVGRTMLKIQSRFDQNRGDFFLHYMLQKVLSLNLFNLNHSNDWEEVFDLIMFLFPILLKNALVQGIYKEYKTTKHNDDNIRGSINLNYHLTHNTPFAGKIAYSTRDYACDNNMMQLVRHTIEYIRTKKCGDTVLNIDRETIEDVKSVIDHTPSYKKSERNHIIGKNLRAKVHPYFTAYQPLQNLCLQILRMEEIKYGDNNEEICGVLFDGAWLWEEYLNTILSQCGYKHPENKYGKGAIYLFEDNTGERYPDFYKTDIVLDAKYKRLASYDRVSQVDRDDIHQVITYMQNLKATKGGFIAPLEEKQTTIPCSTLKGTTSTLSIFGLEISKAENFKEFCREMNNFESKFLNVITI